MSTKTVTERFRPQGRREDGKGEKGNGGKHTRRTSSTVCAPPNTHTNTRARTHSHTHARTHTHTCTHARTHARTQCQMGVRVRGDRVITQRASVRDTSVVARSVLKREKKVPFEIIFERKKVAQCLTQYDISFHPPPPPTHTRTHPSFKKISWHWSPTNTLRH